MTLNKTTKSALVLATLFVAMTGVNAASESGKDLAFNKKLGNCLACHQISGGSMAGNIAPPLIAMKARFPERAVLRAQIWDATVKNPSSIMPPFGRHSLLTEKQVDKITDFIHKL
jgi:sulfur-oxidizing protein SoxX